MSNDMPVGQKHPFLLKIEDLITAIGPASQAFMVPALFRGHWPVINLLCSQLEIRFLNSTDIKPFDCV